MTFSFTEFARVNRVILIWTAFAAFIYLLRDMFGLVFITFIMSFIAHSLSRGLSRFTGQRRRFMVVMIYMIFLIGILCFFFFAIPKILNEAKNFTEQLPTSLKIIDEYLDKLVAANPSIEPAVERIRKVFTIDALASQGWHWTRGAIERIWHYFSWFFIAILFSFLIMLDLPELIRKVRALRYTRMSAIYEETATSVILFAKVVGENFRAQIFISSINTVLTIVGLHIIGTGTVALLAIVVFCCGLIPVLGVIISSVPIMLVALNAGGINMVFGVIALIVIIHCLEAYVLNPRIVSAVMKINPVITLMILYIAHSLMGMWGMLLGVPISVYFYRQILVNHDQGDMGQPLIDERFEEKVKSE